MLPEIDTRNMFRLIDISNNDDDDDNNNNNNAGVLYRSNDTVWGSRREIKLPGADFVQSSGFAFTTSEAEIAENAAVHIRE